MRTCGESPSLLNTDTVMFLAQLRVAADLLYKAKCILSQPRLRNPRRTSQHFWYCGWASWREKGPCTSPVYISAEPGLLQRPSVHTAPSYNHITVASCSKLGGPHSGQDSQVWPYCPGFSTICNWLTIQQRIIYELKCMAALTYSAYLQELAVPCRQSGSVPSTNVTPWLC